MIGPAFRTRAEHALAAIEQEEGIRILLAVESGSRAWGFPSCDSDYDVRFVYVRPVNAYLRIAPPRDVIERPIQDDLDLGGWDLRKALGLIVKSNAVVLEWLASPIVYRSDPTATATLHRLARMAAHLPALAYHYDRLARGACPARMETEVRLKSYFYALRPALALNWLRNHGTPPPMELPTLLAGVAVTAAVTDEVQALLLRKAKLTEAATVPRQPALDLFLATALAERTPRPPAWDQEPVRTQADILFRDCATATPDRTAP